VSAGAFGAAIRVMQSFAPSAERRTQRTSRGSHPRRAYG